MEVNNTETQKKKVSANDTIVSMLNHINMDKRDLFYKSAEEYCKTLAKSGNYHHRIKRLIDEKPLKLMRLDSLSDDIKKLVIQNKITEDNVYLNEKTKIIIDELLLEWKNAETYKFHNIPIRNKILLYGPTGNGKTTLARHIAKLTDLPFVEINADMIIESKIGNSGLNIYKIFNQTNQPCVLFWDEIDSIGRKRGLGTDSAAGMENERMVNSFLINFEKLNSEVIFIGATNRKEIIDSAFLRRFDLQFELSSPSNEEKNRFAKQMYEYYKLPTENIVSFDSYNSFSDIKLELLNIARKHIVEQLTKEE